MRADTRVRRIDEHERKSESHESRSDGCSTKVAVFERAVVENIKQEALIVHRQELTAVSVRVNRA